MIRAIDCRNHLLSFPCSVEAPFTSSLRPWKNLRAPFFPRNPNSRNRKQCCSSKRTGPNWDSNAEGVRTGRFRSRDEAFDEEESDGRFRPRKKRNWWSDDPSEFDEEPELLDDESSPFDSLWIVKLFRPYGLLLPAVILSTLLATGPKAFLMALALPLGQSALSLAVDKLWGRTRDASRRTSKARKKPFGRAANNVEREDKVRDGSSKGRSGSQSWPETADNVVEKDVNPHGSSFGGWDELDRRGESKSSPASQPSQRKGRPPRPKPEQGKLARGRRYTGVPLFMRLLIAFFPFLGSWTRLF